MFGSGQWTVWEGYAALKLMKAGFRSTTSIRTRGTAWPPRRSASARTFGIDEPMELLRRYRSYRRLVLWGSNMARCTRSCGPGRRPQAQCAASRSPCSQLSNIARSTLPTSAWCSSRTPISICAMRSPITSSRPGGSTRTSSPGTTPFKRGQTDIGYGLRPEHPLEKKATGRANARRLHRHELRGLRQIPRRLRLERAAGMSGVALNHLEALAELYADPKTKVMSASGPWASTSTARGVWCQQSSSTTSTC